MGTTTVSRPDSKTRPSGLGSKGNGHRGGGPFGPGDGGSPGRQGPGSGDFQPDKYRIAVWVVIVGVLMLFVSLSSAYVIRRTPGLSGESGANDWPGLWLPPILWFNTAAIVISSVTMEASRRFLRRGGYLGFNRWIVITLVLGFAFLAGQLVAWRQLAHQGIYLATNPHSSFFYLFTCLHGIHLLGGIAALAYVAVKGIRFQFGQRHDAAVYATSMYWHFMDGLWVFLFVLLFFWR